ncbi:unnamed protein product [Protopolystoma xenopodis]|uniref:Uncharacterized protein n=1 Tax=Protopolystoma xenopodis TaxID=117903 RepID=A0A3S5AWN4_9PLAT|nr:unnamed protein product [Protopolystoma xenopodis]
MPLPNADSTNNVPPSLDQCIGHLASAQVSGPSDPSNSSLAKVSPVSYGDPAGSTTCDSSPNTTTSSTTVAISLSLSSFSSTVNPHPSDRHWGSHYPWTDD